MRSKYRDLLADPDVNRWYNNVARGSEVTADVYLRRLGSFCEAYKLTPKALLLMNDVNLYNLLMDFVSSREKEFAGSYIQSIIKAVKSWLSHNHRELKGKIKIRGAEDTPSLKDERVPSKDELRKIFFSGDKKARVACVLIAHSGLRIETLGNYSGDDGLRIKDFPEIEIKNGIIEFKKIPTIVIVRKELSKARHQYFTFLSEEGCEYLKDYLEERIREGEKLTLDSPVITPKLRMKPFIRAINIGDIIRIAIRKAGFPWRPYVLRSYFDTQLMLAESKGLVLRDYRQFWMGHKGDIENRYTTNKQKLPESVIEDMREAYKRSQEYLQTTRVEATSEEKVKESFRKQLLLVAGFKKEEIEKMDLLSLSDEEFQSMVRQKLLGTMINNGAKQKVVGINEVEAYLSQGWEFVASLPNNKAIMKIPF
ncbi:site-specific integrase [Candidatus Bathyarchaeota archaeon]|nr:site-specific integrase [Candidatus Bathyarchaeota archaeon]